MFNSLREELNKIALLEEDNELDELDEMEISDNGAADDELVDDVDEDYEDMEDDVADEVENSSGFASPSDIDSIVESLLLEGSPCSQCGECGDKCKCHEDCDGDDYDDDDEDSIDYDEGVIGDGDDDMLYDDDDEEDSLSGEIDGTTNSINLDEDIYEDMEEDYDDLLEAILGECDDACEGVYANKREVFGDASDLPDTDTPPSPQYEKVMKRKGASGREFVDFGNANYKKYGNVFLDKSLLGSVEMDDEDYEDEGNDYDLFASAGDIYNDDDNEEFYGIRSEVSTGSLYGRHSINNINAAKLKDRFGSDEDALDESVSAFLQNYLD